ncbi:MAG TPA: CHAT domain-containing protein, partial [Candidatus Mcinerneyibacteriales bacterium]|nr:CHAT domain-containing protein [Candidatus Mcinerneyibacteriales bacterium]
LMQYLYGFALTYVGTSYEMKGRTDLTLAAYEEALDLVVSSVSRRPQEGIMHLTLGWLYEEMERLGQGQYLEMALGEYRTGLALADTDDRLLRGYFEKNMANIYFKLRIFDKALDYYTAMSGKIPPYQGRQEEKQYLLRLSTIHYNLNQYEEAASFDRKLLTLYLEDQDIRGQDYTLKHLGMVTSLSGKHLESVRYFERALSLGLSEEDPVRQVLYHRNIAYNALLGDDTDKALFHAKKGLDLLQGNQERKKEGGGLLDISIAMALSGAQETGAYQGFTPEMERNLLLSIMAAASMNKGEMSAAVDLFKEKLAVSDSPYADMVITNNFASLYYRIGNDQLLQEYLERSLEISRENKFQKGLLINELSSLFLNMDSSPDPLGTLESMEERVKVIRDPALQELHQWMMILAFMKTAPREESFSTLREAVDRQEKDFRRYENIRSLLQKPGVSPAMKRLFYLFLHQFLGEDVLSSLISLQGEDDFLDFLINIDAALMTRRSSPESCFEFLEKASDSINRADDKTAPRFAAFFRDKGYIPFQLLEDAITEKTDFDRLVHLLAGFESFEERIRYLFYKPDLFSQLDTVNLGNYFYYLGREDLTEVSRYAEKLDQRARLISGIPFVKGEGLRRMLSSDDIIAYRLNEKFLLLTRDSARIEPDIPPEATFIIDRKADSFRSSAYNAFSLSQLYLLYEGRHMPRPWAVSEGKPLIEESSGYFRLSGSLESDPVNPYACKAGDYTGLQFLKEGLTVDGLWVDEAEDISPISMRLFTDILIYAGLNTIKIGETTFSYREMTEKQFASFLAEKTSEIDRRAYLYYKEGHYSRSFRELANLIPLLKARKDTATLTSRLYLMITIATDHLRDPELIRQELKEYISLKGLPESAYEKNLAILYERTGFYSRAIALYKEGRIPGDQTLQLASLYEKNGQYEEASELLKLVNTEESLIRQAVIHYKYFNENGKARALLEKVRSRDKQQTVELLKGSISLREGDYETAKALFRPLTDSTERNIRINAAIGMANLLFKTNAYHECLDYIRRTLQSLPEKENQAERVILKNLLSLALLETGSEHLALSEIDGALETARRYNIVGETTALIINKSLILRETGRPEEALALLESELPEAQARNNSYLLKGLYRHLAITSYQLGSSGQALLYLGKMKDLGRLTPEESMYASYYTGLVTKDITMLEKARQEALDIRDTSTALEIANHLGLLSGRIDHFEMAVSLLESMAEGMGSPGLQVKLLKKYQGIYRSLAEAYFDAGLFEKSFFTTEKVKRIAFLVNNPLGAGQSTLTPEEEEALDKLKKELYHLDLLMKNDASIMREYEARKEDLDRLKLEIAMNQKGSADIPGEQDFAGTFPRGTLVLSFLVLENRTLLLSWLDGVISGYSIPAGKETLNEEVSHLRDLISETAGEEVIRGESSRLGDLLLPFDLPKSGRLIVSPSGVLNYLPFSLLVKKGEYLIDRFPVTYIPDIFMLRENYGAGPFRSILAVGNPDLDNPDLELYFAQKEAGEIRFIFGPITDILKGKAATEEAVREKMASKDYDIIHFACHGYFNRHYSLLSHLLLASGGLLDGRFDVEEIRNLTPQARLAVLSACDSGVGVLGDGDEVTALDRAFMKTEESAVISALWRISDVATGMLFKHFYRELDKGTPAPLALWKAKKELRLFFPHPAYWSSMKYTGN